jgi:hypothetical protein
MAEGGRRIPGEIQALPHWARVAFAARCARSVLPLFGHSWPTAKRERVAAVESAISWAERSAAEGQPVPNLREATSNAIRVAGAAILPICGSTSDEELPVGESACLVASFVAKSAEWAARAADENSSRSADGALEAYSHAREAARLAEEPELLDRLHGDFEGLTRVARRGDWDDRTPVPSTVFDLISTDSERRSWWKIW